MTTSIHRSVGKEISHAQVSAPRAFNVQFCADASWRRVRLFGSGRFRCPYFSNARARTPQGGLKSNRSTGCWIIRKACLSSWSLTGLSATSAAARGCLRLWCAWEFRPEPAAERTRPACRARADELRTARRCGLPGLRTDDLEPRTSFRPQLAVVLAPPGVVATINRATRIPVFVTVSTKRRRPSIALKRTLSGHGHRIKFWARAGALGGLAGVHDNSGCRTWRRA
jgi:hypothetical protein